MQNYLADRHIGLTQKDLPEMLSAIGVESVEQLINQVIPSSIRLSEPLDLDDAPLTEAAFLAKMNRLAAQNKSYDSYIGQGFYQTLTPAVIQRNVLENPVWYTSYTPYQAEVSQGRLEALFIFQTVVADLTGLPLANCSLLDEATAAAETMTMLRNLRSREQVKKGVCKFFVDKAIFPQTLAVMMTRALGQGIELVVGDYALPELDDSFFGALVQYPNAKGSVEDYTAFVQTAHDLGLKVGVVADLLSLALLNSPASFGADVCCGSAQRLGIPMGFGGPSVGYMACREEYKREIPGRIIGLSKDTEGRPAYRLALQTREQHIKREKATSNLCTAEALTAMMAGFYAVWHGPKGLRRIAEDIHSKATYLSEMVQAYGYEQLNATFFDTLCIRVPENIEMASFRLLAEELHINLYYDGDPELTFEEVERLQGAQGDEDSEHKARMVKKYEQGTEAFDSHLVMLSIGEGVDIEQLNNLITLFAQASHNFPCLEDDEQAFEGLCTLEEEQMREIDYLQAPVFENYHSETEMMRFLKRLERKDISLTQSMIPLGSCTMKLNPAAAMIPISFGAFMNLHPMVPRAQAKGYEAVLSALADDLCAITGFDQTTLQPTSGAAGEFTGLVIIRDYLHCHQQDERRVILIPASAHGTNPASCVQAGFEPVVVACDEKGDIDVADWEKKANENAERLAGCMLTYPSTHGIFESQIKQLCELVHQLGGLVYMDGANMNAQIGYTNPATIGADLCHLNLHKTFACPHGGGGPGVGAVCASNFLIDSLPTDGLNRVSTSLYGNANMALIAYGYIHMMGAEGLKNATEAAIVNANYLACRLNKAYGIVYTGETGRVGHELILDCREFKPFGITETDIAKRLMDFGFHAPTLSFPVHGTLMVEPTESESKAELDRFVEAMLIIRQEIEDVITGKADKVDNVLLNAPHAEQDLLADTWTHPYTRTQAAYPADWVRANKFFLPVSRVDNGFGDRNLVAKL